MVLWMPGKECWVRGTVVLYITTLHDRSLLLLCFFGGEVEVRRDYLVPLPLLYSTVQCRSVPSGPHSLSSQESSAAVSLQ